MSFDEKFIYYSAPSLCGIKPCSLYSVSSKDFFDFYNKVAELNSEVNETGHKLAVIKRSESLYLFLIYDYSSVQKLLQKPLYRSYLSGKGYDVDHGAQAVIDNLLFNLSDTDNFPHEIGLFLGYPIEDVIGYEKDFGRTSKYSGLWQVYGDVNEACRKMNLYRNCEKICCRLYKEGTGISSLKNEYMKISEKESFIR